jgi:quercetin dioxygenase-like cupin family protein
MRRLYMKRRVFTVVLALTAALGLFIAAQGAFCQIGKVYEIYAQDGTSMSKMLPSPAFADAGVKGWTVQALVDAGSEFYIYQVEANAAMDAHKSPDEWIGYVLEGSVQVKLTDANGAQKSVISLKKGDAMVFRADTMHAYKIGPTKTYMLFVKPKAAE